MTDTTEQALHDKAQVFIASLSDEQRAELTGLLQRETGDDAEVSGYMGPLLISFLWTLTATLENPETAERNFPTGSEPPSGRFGG
jgi:hypothetical protein